MFRIMFYVGFVGANIFLIISIVLFVRNNVAKLIGDVTGWNTKRAMKELRKMRVVEQSVDMHVEVQESSIPVGFFAVEESVVVIHTEEQIDIE